MIPSPDSPDSNHFALVAMKAQASRVGCAIAVVKVGPPLGLSWICADSLSTYFSGGEPNINQLFAATRTEDQPLLSHFWEQVNQGSGASCDIKLQGPGGEEAWFHLDAVEQDILGEKHTLFSCMNMANFIANGQEHIEKQRKDTIQSLAAGIAHEFNNYLTPIRGFIELSLDVLGPDHNCADGLTTALNQAEACAQLVKQILTSSSKSILTLRKVSIARLLSNIVADSIHTDMPDGSINVIQDIADDLPQMWIDHEIFRDAIRQLISNAINAMPNGGDLTVRGKLIAEDKWIELEIEDTGCGMSPTILSKVFDPFFTTQNRAQARGMGLPMVRGMVTQLGGDINIRSEVHQGTTVTVRLPARKNRDEAPSSIDMPYHAPKEEEEVVPPTGHMLIADDEDYVLKLITRIFTKQNWDVEQAASSYEVLNSLEANPNAFDVLILDISMPGPPPEETLNRLKSAKCSAHIVLVSGLPYDNRMQELERISGGIFIGKPFSLNSLTAKVAELTGT